MQERIKIISYLKVSKQIKIWNFIEKDTIRNIVSRSTSTASSQAVLPHIFSVDATFPFLGPLLTARISVETVHELSCSVLSNNFNTLCYWQLCFRNEWLEVLLFFHTFFFRITFFFFSFFLFSVLLIFLFFNGFFFSPYYFLFFRRSKPVFREAEGQCPGLVNKPMKYAASKVFPTGWCFFLWYPKVVRLLMVF